MELLIAFMIIPVVYLTIEGLGNWHSPLTGGFFTCGLYGDNMSALYEAYAEYLERMIEETDDLPTVDLFTVPTDVNLVTLSEWADVN